MTTKSQASGSLRWVGPVLTWTVMLGFGAILLASLVVPRLAGATPYVVETGSMRPSMPPGTLVVVRSKPVAEIGVGDVMTYQIRSGDPTVVTHRVITQGFEGTGQPRWRTQGDANDAADPSWVLPMQVKGVRWYSVPYLGYVTSLVDNQQRGLLTGLVVLGLIGYALSMFRKALRDRKGAARQETATPVQESTATVGSPTPVAPTVTAAPAAPAPGRHRHRADVSS